VTLNRVNTVQLMPVLRSELLALLEGLRRDEWQAPTPCPGWSVHAVACHLLGVELGNVSARRDGWKLVPSDDGDADAWLNAFNQQWVEATRRISPALLIELLSLAGERFEQHIATLDLDAMGGPVRWATADNPAPVWLDVAREYMERFVHQYQVREAVGRPALAPHLLAPVLATAVHALPQALAQVDRSAGTCVLFSAEGEGGGTWGVLRTTNGWELVDWELTADCTRPPACEVRTTVDGALGLLVRDPTAPTLDWHGDPELARAVGTAKAVLG
jgi:uncharacterized protein (TIGR03083 family)